MMMMMIMMTTTTTNEIREFVYSNEINVCAIYLNSTCWMFWYMAIINK